jgi:hypothetical protein
VSNTAQQLEAAFGDIKSALSAAERNRAHTRLKILLDAHAAPEAAEIAALERLQPMTTAYYQKLEHIRIAAAGPAAHARESA